MIKLETEQESKVAQKVQIQMPFIFESKLAERVDHKEVALSKSILKFKSSVTTIYVWWVLWFFPFQNETTKSKKKIFQFFVLKLN